MRILITGITGYIGSNLARHLLKQHQIFGLSHGNTPRSTYISSIQDQVEWLPYTGDGNSLSSQLQSIKPDLVYHLATYYTGSHEMEHIPKLIESNIVLGTQLLQAMAQAQCSKLIYTTSIMEHYQSQAYCPLNLYAATKKAFSDILEFYTNSELIQSGTLVLSDTYGSDDQRPKILNLIRNHQSSSETLALSDGQQDYVLVHVDDVVRALDMAEQQLCAREWANRTFQVLPKQCFTLRQTVETWIKLNNAQVNLAWGKRPAPARDMRRMVKIYPPVPRWQPLISLEQGLRLLGK